MFQLGIDVSKKTLDLCLLREGVKGRVKTRKLQNDINAVSAVIAWLSKQHCKPEDVHIIMEATGVYHELRASQSRGPDITCQPTQGKRVCPGYGNADQK